jgi:hypothetical protein
VPAHDFLVLSLTTFQGLKEATLLFSRHGINANLTLVIPVMDQIDDDFTAIMEQSERQWHPSIRAAVGLAKKTLNKYYSLTDSSEIYRIAISECFVLYLHVLSNYFCLVVCSASS